MQDKSGMTEGKLAGEEEKGKKKCARFLCKHSTCVGELLCSNMAEWGVLLWVVHREC